MPMRKQRQAKKFVFYSGSSRNVWMNAFRGCAKLLQQYQYKQNLQNTKNYCIEMTKYHYKFWIYNNGNIRRVSIWNVRRMWAHCMFHIYLDFESLSRGSYAEWLQWVNSLSGRSQSWQQTNVLINIPHRERTFLEVFPWWSTEIL